MTREASGKIVFLFLFLNGHSIACFCPDRNDSEERVKLMIQEKEGDNQACHVTTYNSKVTLPIFPVRAGIFWYFSHFLSLAFKAEKQKPKALMFCLINQTFPRRLRAIAASPPIPIFFSFSKITTSTSFLSFYHFISVE